MFIKFFENQLQTKKQYVSIRFLQTARKFGNLDAPPGNLDLF